MVKADFVHLHTHSYYSLKEGIPSPEDLASEASRQGYEALALTDTNTLAGIPAFVKACRAHGLRPILGSSISILPFRTRMPGSAPEGIGEIFRVTLLVRNETGFQNLVKLVNRCHRNLHAGKPAIKFSDLEQAADGLFFLTGAHQGELYHLLKRARIEETEEYLQRLIHAFGRSHVFFELVFENEERERTINGRMVQLANFLELGIVATNDVRYLFPEDEAAYLCLCGGETLLEAGAGTPFGEILSSPDATFHLAAPLFMKEKFRDYPNALKASREIAEACGFDLLSLRSSRETRLPLHDFVRGQDADSFLWDTIFERASHRYGSLPPQIKDRLNMEFDSIKKHGMANDLVFLHRVSAFLSEKGIQFLLRHDMLGASLIAYLLGLTDIDPLKFHIRFQPFTEPDDFQKPAAFDVPSCHIEEIVEWIRAMFPQGAVCEIGTYPAWTRHALLDHIAGWARLSREDAAFFFREAAREPDKTPDQSRIVNEKQETSPVPSESLTPYQMFIRENRDRLPLCSADFLLALFSRLYPRPRSLQPARGSLAFCAKDLESILPCEWKEERQVSQFGEDLMDDLGLHRVRILPNSLLDILHDAVEWVRNESNPQFTADSIDFTDAETYQLLGEGLTDGIYPFDSITVKSLLQRSKPRGFMDLVKIMTEMEGQDAVKERTGEDRSSSIAWNIAFCRLGFQCAYIKTHYPVSFMTAVLTHAALGKAVGRGMEKISARFSKKRLPKDADAATDRGESEGGLEQLAPEESSRFISLLRHTRRLGIDLKPPSVNESAGYFSQEGDGIRTGLMVVRHMGDKAARELMTIRQGGPFHDLADLCHRTDSRLVNLRLLKNLIKAGALDSFGLKRSQLLHVLEQTIGFAREGDAGARQISSLFDPKEMDLFSQMPDIPEFTPEELMRLEREATGYTVTRYPLEPYLPLLDALGAISSRELSTKHEGMVKYIGGFIDHRDEAGPLIAGDVRMVLDFEGLLVRVSGSVIEKFSSGFQINLPVLVGGIVQRNGDFPSLYAQCCFPLEELLNQVVSIQKIVINCAIRPLPDKDILKKIHRLLKRFYGHTKVEVINVPEGCGAIAQKMSKMTVLFCPPLYYELNNLLSPESLVIYTTGPAPDDVILPKW